MALSITATASATEIKIQQQGSGLFTFTDISIVEDDEFLSSKLVQGEVDWGDGEIEQLSSGATASPLEVGKLSHTFKAGFYNIVISAVNFRSPTPDSKTKAFPLTVLQSVNSADVEIGDLFGFILPKDQGFPSAEQWQFNSGKDLEIIQSSVKMLLSTAKGERLMDPQYGTKLREIIFNQMEDDVQTFAENEIQSALQQYEPRAQFNHLSVSKGDREITIAVQLVWNKTPFEVVKSFPV